MQITRTRSKYYVLTVLGALMVAAGVFVLAPQAPQAQAAPSRDCETVQGAEFCLEKTVSPNPATVGEPVFFTVELSLAPNAQFFLGGQEIQDVLPPGVEFVSATPSEGTCAEVGGTVTCDGILVDPGETVTVTIEVILTQCGAFTNTAKNPSFDLMVQAPFTVVGCDEEVGGGGSAAPITQEGEQESESGEVDQTFEVS